MTANIYNFDKREEWEEDRRNGLGGSDAAAILGVDPHRSRMEVFLDKRGHVPETPAKLQKIYSRGRRHEEWIAEDYEEDYGRRLVDHGLHIFQSPEIPWLRCSVDREIIPIEDFPGPGVLEAKSMFGMSQKAIEEETPIHFVIQVMHELAVLGWEWGSLAVLHPVSNALVKVDMERNQPFIDMLLKEEEQFWHYVQANELPPVDASDSCTKALAALYPEDDQTILELDSDLAAVSKRLQANKGAIDELVLEQNLMKNQMRAAFKSATWGRLPSGEWYSLKHIHKRPYTVKEQNYRALRGPLKKGPGR